jgi:molecular chaperone DnaK (HSP70)
VDKDRVTAAQPSIEVRVGSMTLTLDSPRLSLTEFEEILEPFVEEEFLFRREMDFGAATSIFSPIMDVLGRAGLAPSEVDAVLPVGGSVLIPQITLSLEKFFPRSDLLAFPTAEAAQVAVARGAAWHSFLLKGVSRPMIRPIAQENIGLLTRAGGFAVLIPAGTELPHPADGKHAAYSGLMVPKEFMKGVNIVVAADGPDKILATAHLQFDEVPRSGEPIGVRYRLDGNKVLEVEAWLEDRPDVMCSVTLENPLSATAVTDETEQRILELEQQVGELLHAGRNADLADAMVELGDLNQDTRRNEKAVSWYQNALRVRKEPDSRVLNRFNYSLHLDDGKRLDEALAETERACEIEGAQPVYRAWKGILLKQLKKDKAGKEELEKAVEEFEYLEPEEAWSLHWQRRAYLALDQKDKADKIAEKLAKAKGSRGVPIVHEDLPAQKAGQITRE